MFSYEVPCCKLEYDGLHSQWWCLAGQKGLITTLLPSFFFPSLSPFPNQFVVYIFLFCVVKSLTFVSSPLLSQYGHGFMACSAAPSIEHTGKKSHAAINTSLLFFLLLSFF